jgi:hypothetical protein
MDGPLLYSLIIIAGIAHILLSIASLAIPRVLKWKQHLVYLPPLLRQIFWTYAAYILVINFCFGIVSLIAADELLNGSMLARSITFFIFIYWLARIGIQFFYFDRSEAPPGIIYVFGEIVLVLLFLFFAVVYVAAFLHDVSLI